MTRRPADHVAQVSNLLYRGFPTRRGRWLYWARCRLEVGDTAQRGKAAKKARTEFSEAKAAQQRTHSTTWRRSFGPGLTRSVLECVCCCAALVAPSRAAYESFYSSRISSQRETNSVDTDKLADLRHKPSALLVDEPEPSAKHAKR